MKTNHQAGHDKEKLAANYLTANGYKILDLNWRTKYCEIDIIAKNNNRLYFYEVKSRASNAQGFGYEYVTPKKLEKMKFAAELWVAANHWKGEYQLAVASVDDDKIQLFDELG